MVLRRLLLLVYLVWVATFSASGQDSSYGQVYRKLSLLGTLTKPDSLITVDDSTYVVQYDFATDQSGGGYVPADILPGDRLVLANAQHYRIAGATPEGFTTATLQLVRLPGSASSGPPALDYGVVYRYTAADPYIPLIPHNAAGIPQAMATLVANHNYRLLLGRLVLGQGLNPSLSLHGQEIIIEGTAGVLVTGQPGGVLNLTVDTTVVGAGAAAGGSITSFTTETTPDSVAFVLQQTGGAPPLIAAIANGGSARGVAVADPLPDATVQDALLRLDTALTAAAGGVTQRTLLSTLAGLSRVDLEWRGVAPPTLSGTAGEFTLTIPAGTRVYSLTVEAEDAEAATNGSSGFTLTVNNQNSVTDEVGTTGFVRDYYQLQVTDHDGYDVVDYFASANFYYRQIPGTNGAVTHRLLSIGTALSSGFTLLFSR